MPYIPPTAGPSSTSSSSRPSSSSSSSTVTSEPPTNPPNRHQPADPLPSDTHARADSHPPDPPSSGADQDKPDMVPSLRSLPSTLAAMSIQSTTPNASSLRQLDGEIGAELYSPASHPLHAGPVNPEPTPAPAAEGGRRSSDEVPGLSATPTTSASSTSIESLESEDSPMTTDTGEGGKSTPATSVGLVEVDEREDGVRMYRRGLYLYTRELYLEAKLSSSKSDKRRGSISTTNQFGQKQSGMEKLAQKKALARRLNG